MADRRADQLDDRLTDMRFRKTIVVGSQFSESFQTLSEFYGGTFLGDIWFVMPRLPLPSGDFFCCPMRYIRSLIVITWKSTPGSGIVKQFIHIFREAK
jgi:hypothetical protein